MTSDQGGEFSRCSSALNSGSLRMGSRNQLTFRLWSAAARVLSAVASQSRAARVSPHWAYTHSRWFGGYREPHRAAEATADVIATGVHLSPFESAKLWRSYYSHHADARPLEPTPSIRI